MRHASLSSSRWLPSVWAIETFKVHILAADPEKRPSGDDLSLARCCAIHTQRRGSDCGIYSAPWHKPWKGASTINPCSI